MSFRNRIVVAVLLVTLLAPVTASATLQDRDPDGQSVRIASAPTEEPDTSQPRTETVAAALRTQRQEPQNGLAFVLDRFLDWMRAVALFC